MRKLLVRILQGALILVAGIVVLAFVFSPQITKPFLDQNEEIIKSSISEIRTVDLNGINQRILIRGENRNNPILLHLHGGPGGADQAIVRSSGKTVEDLFTVVYWDQRGAGASHNSSLSSNSLSLEKIVNDGISLASYLRTEFDRDKIYLQGHSWGTLVGTNMIAKSPSQFYAYFGIGHIANSRRAESLSYNYTLDAAQKAGDRETVNALKKFGAPPYENDQEWIDNVMVERALMQPYEIPGEEPYLSLVEIYSNFIFYKAYSVQDKLNSLEGSKRSLQALWIEAVNADLFTSHPNLPIPVYFFQGKYDMHTVTEVARDYYEMVKAPHKEYFSFDKSAHWPHLEEHEKYRKLLKRILSEAPKH